MAVAKKPPCIKCAVEFNGNGDYMEVILPSFPFNTFTVEILFKDYKHDSHRYERHIGLYDSARGRMWNLYTSRFEPHKLIFEIWRDDGTMQGIRICDTELNKWIHAVVTFNSTTYRAYVNAELKATVEDVAPRDLGEYYLCIASARGVDYAWDYIALIRLYDRVLSESEIRWNKCRAFNPVRDGLVLWLVADDYDPSAGVWYDRSPYRNNATAYGNPRKVSLIP